MNATAPITIADDLLLSKASSAIADADTASAGYEALLKKADAGRFDAPSRRLLFDARNKRDTTDAKATALSMTFVRAMRTPENCGFVEKRKVEAALARLEKLEAFYREVVVLTVRHEDLNGSAVVYPADLGAALERVNPKWWSE